MKPIVRIKFPFYGRGFDGKYWFVEGLNFRRSFSRERPAIELGMALNGMLLKGYTPERAAYTEWRIATKTNDKRKST